MADAWPLLEAHISQSVAIWTTPVSPAILARGYRRFRTTDLRRCPVKLRALRPGVEAQQRRGQDERADTPDEEVPVLQQQPKKSVEEKC